LTEQPNQMTVHIKHGNLQETISGSPEQVWLLLNKFFNNLLPSFETARKLTLQTDLQAITKEIDGIIAFAEEGPYIMFPRNKLTDNETLALLLLANYVGFQLGKLKSDGLSKDELQTKLGKDAKITSTRLGELVKNEVALRTVDEKYKMTTFGLVQMQKDVLPKIRSKTGP
jgi:hypothetical protein